MFDEPHSRASWTVTAAIVFAAIAVWGWVFVRDAQRPLSSNDIHYLTAEVDGDSSTPLQVVYFYQPDCPYCAEVNGPLRRLVRDHPSLAHVSKVYFPEGGNEEAALHFYCEGHLQSAGCDDEDRDAVVADIALTRELDVTSVPDIRIGQNRVVGAAPYAMLDSLLHAVTDTHHEG